MSAPPGIVERIALALVPVRDREALLGDLAEEAGTVRGRAAGILSVGLWYQAEPWRDDRARAGILVLFAAGLALLRLLPLAAGAMDFLAVDGAVWRGAARFWSHDLEIAATAAGLLVGRAPLVPDGVASARWHLAALLALAALLSARSWTDGTLAAALLVAAAFVGSAARTAAPPPSAT